VSKRRLSIAGALVLVFIAVTAHAQTYTKPNVRAITAFIRLDPATLDRQIADALIVLRAAKGDFAQRGYKTETIRIVTQPLGELVSGQTDDDALRLLKAIDDLSAKEGSFPVSAGDDARFGRSARSCVCSKKPCQHCPIFKRIASLPLTTEFIGMLS